MLCDITAWALISRLLLQVKRFFIFSYVYGFCACEQDGTLIIKVKISYLWGQVLVGQMSQLSSTCVTR